jgi:hypothetical protein
MSELSLPLVCPSNCGCGSFTLITAVRPSRTSSPVRFSFDVLEQARRLAAALMVRVSALRNPLRCEPPSTVLMLLAKLNTLSVAVVVLQRHFHGERCRRWATRARLQKRWACRAGRSCRLLRCLMNSAMPPLK